MTKSHVSLEQAICVVCGAAYDTGAVLLDRSLRNSMEHKTVMGYGMCPADEKRRADGYIALVELDPSRSGATERTATIKPSDACRTGVIAHIKSEAFPKMFNVALPERGVAYVEPGVIEALRAKIELAPDQDGQDAQA